MAYKRASDNGRNGIGWAFAGLGVFIGTQLIVTFIGGLVLGLMAIAFGWPIDDLDSGVYTWPIYLVAIAASIAASMLLLKFADTPAKGYTPPPASSGPLGL